jgi:hypothetical protein
MPVREKGQGAPVRSLHVPSHVPSHPQNAAKVRAFSGAAPGLTAETDWLLEQRRFELSVPPLNASVPRGATWVLRTAPGFGVALLRSAIVVRGCRPRRRLRPLGVRMLTSRSR